VSTAVAAGLVVVAFSAGLANLRAAPGVVPEDPSSPACAATDLDARAALEGAAGSVLGSVEVTNRSAETCTLEGRPTLTLFSAAGHELQTEVVDAPAQWQADGASAPDGWPVVTLDPGSAAALRVRWTNPCPQLSAPALWRVDLGNGMGTVDVFGADTTYPPPCLGPTEPSTFELGPFEPSESG
jgi:hypothetical protein